MATIQNADFLVDEWKPGANGRESSCWLHFWAFDDNLSSVLLLSLVSNSMAMMCLEVVFFISDSGS